MDIQESGETYLETILVLQKECSSVRSIDIAKSLNVSKASVSKALKLLTEKGYLVHETYSGNIVLTEKGKERAAEVFLRHTIIKNYLIKQLNLSEKIAETDACRIEHIISEETLEAMKKHI